jgi:hypothetical protein
MKKKQQIFATIIFILLTFFSSITYADDYFGDFTISDSNDILLLSGYTGVSGSLYISSTSLTSLVGLENLTSVGGPLSIRGNNILSSLSALSNLTSISGELYISGAAGLINLCALYNVSLYGDYLAIYGNEYLSMDTANALETQLRYNGFNGTSDIYNNTGLTQAFCDNDKDTVYDDTDNCPNTVNPNQEDVDSDGIGDVCDENTIYRTVSGDIQTGITVKIYIFSCGAPQPHVTLVTDSQGNYVTGGLPNGRYLVVPEDAKYTFAPGGSWVDIPQAESQSYDFTAALITYGISGTVSGDIQEGVTITLTGDSDATTTTEDKATFIL